MNNILLVGNGFDLAHGLLTKYEHFLYLMKNWDEFYLAFESERKKEKKQEEETIKEEPGFWGNELFAEFFKEPEKPIDKYIKYAFMMDEQRIKRLGNIIKNNSWVEYYCQCGAEIDGWIDFEREIYPVIELFEFVFNSQYSMIGNGDGPLGNAHIERKDFSPSMIRAASLWKRYFNTMAGNSIYVKEPFASMKYGILKKKILGDLQREFDEFIGAYEIYLHEFVYKRNDIKILKQIKALEIGSVISFNYTLTEKLYGIDEKDVHHIHGMLREDLQTGTNNMVVGVNEQENQNMDFIYFVKYFQRIQKASGIKYKEFESRNFENIYGRVNKEKYTVYIYGHSLDETDEDILKYVIGKVHSVDAYSNLELKPEKVVIFFYDQADYEQKVINLIKLYGRSIVEEYMERGKFEFVPTSDEVWSE